MNIQDLKKEIPYNKDFELGDFLSRKGVEDLLDRTWNLAMERAATIGNELKTDERKVATFGEWQAESYTDKMLVNAVIETIATAIHNEKV